MKRRILITICCLAFLLAPAAASARSITEPNDPNYPDQWALAKVGASCAWAVTTGSPDVTVAVVDSGVDMQHPDLVDRLRDDGRDFVDGDNDPSDENGHGTNVAGIIAQTLDNGEGGVGLAPGVKILPIRVMTAKGSGSDRAIARGVRYAADQGAQVINLSLGASLTIDADTVSEQVTSAIKYAQGKGSLVVVAAGNDFLPLENAIVGDNKDVLVVAATDDDDVKANFSNSGPWVGVAAPGVHILSTMPTYDVYLTSSALPRDERFQKNYDYMSGTSQATPFVSALAALLFSAHPDWDAAQVEQAIKDHAADISRMNASLARQGFLGSGRIDACAALGDLAAVATPTSAADAPPVGDAPTPDAGATIATPAPDTDLVPTPAPSVPSAGGLRGLGSDLLIIIGLLGCGAVLLFGLMVFLIVRVTRRPKRAPAPAYAPPPTGAVAPIPAAAQPAYAAPAQPAAWGRISVIAGPSQARAYALSGALTTIGRGDDCAVMLLGDGTVSRRHALIRNDGRQITLEDTGSTHGSWVNGQRVTAPVALRRGDTVQLGQTQLRFE